MKRAIFISGILFAASLHAQPGTPAAMRGFSGMRPGVPTVEGNLPPALRQTGIAQKLDSQVPLDLEFTNSFGERKPLRSYFRGKPVMLALVYYECTMLCNLTLNGVQRGLRAVPTLNAGQDFDVVAVSFDSKEGAAAAAKKRAELSDKALRQTNAAGWHFLTGDAASIRRLADSVGFQYAWDEQTKQWAHSSAVMVLTPEGKVSKYFYGVEYSARDLRLGLVEASSGKIGSPVDQILLFCYHYDPVSGKYGMVIMTILRMAGLATVGLILLFWIVCYLQNKRRKNEHADRIPAFSR